MLRNIAGIVADEEPKTPTSVSGLYNSSDLGSLPSDGSELSSLILNGRSELTLMTWMSVDDFSLLVGSTAIPFVELNFTSFPIQMESSSVSSLIRNSNGGITTVSHSDTYLEDTLYHVCVTQSLSNNRIRIYVNGVLLNSAVMSYNNATTATEFRIKNQDGVSLSQFNAYDRELTESEVAEHYVYDFDLLQQGVLGFDAMTPAQKSGLIYSSSYTDTISIAGNEFTDKSGNNITLSTQPSLTGQQIYVYTNASDLPSSTTIYDVNSATLDGTSQYFDAGNPAEFDIFTANNPYTIEAWYSPKTTSGVGVFIGQSRFTDRTFTLVRNGDDLQVDRSNSAGLDTITIANSLTAGEWYHIVYTYDGSTMSVYLNDATPQTLASSRVAPNATTEVYIGAQGNNPTGAATHDNCQISFVRFYTSALSSSEVTTLYNAGTPLCYDDIPTPITDDCVYAPRLANYNGNAGQELIDQSASAITTTNIGSTPFTGTGLSVECGGSPTTPSNALPSNLPTIL